MGGSSAASARITSHGDWLQHERVELAAEGLHRRVNQANDGIAGVAGCSRVQRERNGADRRVREQLWRGRRVEDVIVIHGENVGVVFQPGQCGIGCGSIIKQQTVKAQFVVATGDFCADQFGQGVSIRARFESHEQFVGDVPGHRFRREHPLRGVFHRRAKHIELRHGIRLWHEREVEVAQQPFQGFTRRQILEFCGSGVGGVRLDIDMPAGIRGDFFQQRPQCHAPHIGVHPVGAPVPDQQIGVRGSHAQAKRG